MLAHEIAHIRRDDFLTYVVAQLGLLLHFYHPLVHWLTGRLRLEQELAADTAAAMLAGGRMTYLRTLASMALRQDDQLLGWPARTFLPTRGHLLRRVEMLKHSKRIPPRLSTASRGILVAILLAVGIGIAGIGAPDLPVAQAEDEAKRKSEKKAEKKKEANSTSIRPKYLQNIMRLASAMHNYHSDHDHFPPAAVIGPDGKTPHSWRIAVLPYLDEEPLYRQYRFDEPWDSTDNKKIMRQMPAIFVNPRCDLKELHTNFLVITGEGTLFGEKKGTEVSDISDGLDKTIMLVEVAEKQAVPWTKPVDLKFNSRKPSKGLGGVEKEGFRVVFANGASTVILDSVVGEDGLRALMTMDAGDKAPESVN